MKSIGSNCVSGRYGCGLKGSCFNVAGRGGEIETCSPRLLVLLVPLVPAFYDLFYPLVKKLASR